MIWIAAALMTIAAVLCVVWPLSKPRGGALGSRNEDLQFYREQMRALERDLDNGLVSAEESAGSRAEIGRRLIAASERADGAGPVAGRRRRLLVAALVVMVVVPAVSLGLYDRVGAPKLRDYPLASRLAAPDPNDIGAAIARIETHLTEHPDDGRGFEVLAPIYERLGRSEHGGLSFDKTFALF